MVQINLFLLSVAATIIPALAQSPYPFAGREDGDIVGSAFSRRFYGGDSIVFARDVDLQEREPSWNAVLHPWRTLKEHRKVKAITAAAKAKAKADIKQEHADALGGGAGATERREYISEGLAERDFDYFDLDARDFEEEY